MSRRAFTLVELLVASVVTSLTAAAMLAMMGTLADAMTAQDGAVETMARVARADVRIADHAQRARLVLAQASGEIALWLPSEAFTLSTTDATDYDTINANELAWYVMNATSGTLALQYLSNRSDRTTYPLSTNWASLRATLSTQSRLTTVPVLEGLASGSFLIEDADPCSVRRFTFTGSINDGRGALAVHLGGLLLNGQRHPDCP
jgi:type II secretory pathway pseudopilin PulG